MVWIGKNKKKDKQKRLFSLLVSDIDMIISTDF